MKKKLDMDFIIVMSFTKTILQKAFLSAIVNSFSCPFKGHSFIGQLELLTYKSSSFLNVLAVFSLLVTFMTLHINF